MEWSERTVLIMPYKPKKSFNPSFSMEWSERNSVCRLYTVGFRVSILVFQWNGLKVVNCSTITITYFSFNPSFSMEWSERHRAKPN